MATDERTSGSTDPASTVATKRTPETFQPRPEYGDSVIVDVDPGSFLLGQLRLQCVTSGGDVYTLFLADLGNIAVCGSDLDGVPSDGLGLHLVMEVRRV